MSDFVNDGAAESLDLLLRWTEAAELLPQERGDCFDERCEEGFELSSIEERAPGEPSGAAGEDERFQRAGELEQAIEKALRQVSEVPEAPVLRQLAEIRRSLWEGALESERAEALIAEAQQYLSGKLAEYASSHAMRHPGVQCARTYTSDALSAWGEAAALMGSFLASRDLAQLETAGLLLDKGSHFLLVAKTTLLQIRPDDDAVTG